MIAGLACKTCCYWSPSPGNREPLPPSPVSYGFASNTGVDTRPPLEKGQCRRFPPFMGQTEHGPRSQWPITLGTHWCGEHGYVVAKREAVE